MSDRHGRLIDEVRAHAEELRRRRAAQLVIYARDRELEGLEASFAKTKNPIFVFGAWEVCRRHETRLPEWAAAEFDRMAKELKSLAYRPRSRDVAAAAGRAIGFGGGTKGDNAFGQIADLQRDEKMLCAYLALRAHKFSSTAAFQRIAQGAYGLQRVGSANTIRARFKARLKQLGLSVSEFEKLPFSLRGHVILAHIARGWDRKPFTQKPPDVSD